MKVLVIGGGGREHALAWKIDQSPRVKEVQVLPGNPGIKNPLVQVAGKISNFHAIIKHIKNEEIDLVVIGPEAPLAEGIVDRLDKEGIRAFGPSAGAAELESSKIFTRELLDELSIPQPGFKVFDDAGSALNEINSHRDFPVVIKADGLAAGKGVIIAGDRKEATAAINSILVEKEFGSAGDRILIEDFMQGKEVSYFVITDGENIISLPTAQDYKRIGNGDIGPNTGGMGCYSPSAFITDEYRDQIINTIIKPTLEGLIKKRKKVQGLPLLRPHVNRRRPEGARIQLQDGRP